MLLAGIFLATLPLVGQIENQAQGIAPRAAATDYQTRAKAGSLTIAAEFLGHAIPGEPGTIMTEDYVVVEAAVYGSAGARATLQASEFSIRINGKKALIPAAHFGRTFQSLKDPEWGPTESEKAKSKTSVGGSGGGQNDPPPLPAKMPIALRRAMEQRVQKAAFPEGDRPLPQAGLLFFPYRGKTDGINSVELYYEGADGKAMLTLQ